MVWTHLALGGPSFRALAKGWVAFAVACSLLLFPSPKTVVSKFGKRISRPKGDSEGAGAFRPLNKSPKEKGR
jgi:hypothetical protein